MSCSTMMRLLVLTLALGGRAMSCPRAHDLGSKTPYSPQGVASGWSSPPDSCSAEPLTINILARHGARHTGHIQDINDLAEHFIATSASLPAWLANYSYPGTAGVDDGNLIPLGAQEHEQLATRLRQAFPSAFPSSNVSYNPRTIKLSSTYVPRTGQSASSFAYGALAGVDGPLSGGHFTPPFIDVASSCMDTRLRFHKNCPAYTTGVSENSSATAQFSEYLETPEYQSAVATLATRAGLSAAEVTAEQLLTAFEACAYDVILDGGNQEKWCSLFDDEAWDVANYASDLDMWYSFAGGNLINSEMPLDLLRDFFGAFDNAVAAYEDESTSALTASWRFAHAETVLPFATMLGVFHAQDTMTAAYRDENRYFRSSVRAPFAANIVATLYACDSSEYMVRFLFNEEEIVIPACSEAGEGAFCALTTLRKAFDDPLQQWDYEAVCEGDRKSVV